MSTAHPRNILLACLLGAALGAARTRSWALPQVEDYKGGEEEMYAQTAHAHRELACSLDVLRPDSIEEYDAPSWCANFF